MRGPGWNNEIRRMFGSISGSYDFLNTLMSFGTDRVLRRRVVDMLDLPEEGRLLDIGAGTGKIALHARRRHPKARIIAADLTLAMMMAGKKRSGVTLNWCAADALHLPFPDASFDAVCSGFLIRNVPDVRAAFAEQVRVVKPGGSVVCLDTSPPPGSIMSPLIRIHLDFIIPFLGGLISGNSSAYRYLPESTKAFKTAREVAEIMECSGLKRVRFTRHLFGAVSIHRGIRSDKILP